MKHASMACGKNEPITIEPVRVLGVVLHKLVVQDVAHWSAPHGEPRVAGVGLLDGVNGEEPDRVDRLLDKGVRGGRLEGLHSRRPGRASPTGSEHRLPHAQEAEGGGGRRERSADERSKGIATGEGKAVGMAGGGGAVSGDREGLGGGGGGGGDDRGGGGHRSVDFEFCGLPW